jgi:hypothetical protein
MKRFIKTFDLLLDCFLVTGALYLVILGTAWADRSLHHRHDLRQFTFSPNSVMPGACESDVDGGNGIIVPLEKRTQRNLVQVALPEVSPRTVTPSGCVRDGLSPARL